MILKEIVDSLYWELVEEKLWDLYYKKSDEIYQNKDSILSDYSDVWNKLKMIEPKISKMRICMDNENNIIGKDRSLQKDQKDFQYFQYKTDEEKERIGNQEVEWALEFMPWNEWLGSNIDDETLKKIPLDEIAAHCLYEMTFVDYDENKIQNEKNNLNNIRQEIDNMNEEERQKKFHSFKSMDDFKTFLENDS